MRIGRFNIRFSYPSGCNVATLDAELTPFLARELTQFGLCNYLPSSRIVIFRPRFLFWLLIYPRRTDRMAANLAAFLRSARIPTLVTMDFLDIQLPTKGHGVSLLEEVSKLVPQTEFISIQHGQELRRFPVDESMDLKRVTLLCFGQWAAENFPRFGRREHKYIPIGALVNSLYLQARPARIQKTSELTIVSTIKDDEWWGAVVGQRRVGYEELVSFVGRYCVANSLTPLVALTIDRDMNQTIDESAIERRWFTDRLGGQIQFTEPTLIFGGLSGLDEHDIAPRSVKERFSSYFASDQSVVTIGMSSTALWEAFGRGNRILAVNLTDNPIYDFPINGIWSMRQPSYEEFVARLNYIRRMTDSEWESLSKDSRELLIQNDVTETVSERIRAQVSLALEENPWRGKRLAT